MLAAALTEYDGSATDITDLTYGEIKFYIKSWSRGSKNIGGYFKEIEAKTCSQEDLKGTAAETPFFEASPTAALDISNYGPKMLCPVNR